METSRSNQQMSNYDPRFLDNYGNQFGQIVHDPGFILNQLNPPQQPLNGLLQQLNPQQGGNRETRIKNLKIYIPLIFIGWFAFLTFVNLLLPVPGTKYTFIERRNWLELYIVAFVMSLGTSAITIWGAYFDSDPYT